jgi:hypothetical protein
MSNFAVIQSEWSTLFGAASKAEGMANTDARTSCFYARRTLELAVDWLYKHDPALRLPYQDHLSALIHEPTFKATAGDAVFTKAKLIKDLGNMAVHSTRIVLRTDAVTATRELFHFCYWLARTYGQRARPAPDLRFDAALIPLPPAPSAVSAAPAQSIEQLQELETQLKASDEKLSVLLPAKAALDDELQQLRLEVAAAKQANTTQPDTHDYSESETRDYFIDLLLKEAGWQLDVKNFEVPVSGMPNKQGVGSHVGETRLKLGDPLDDAQLRDELAGFLHQQVAAMNLDNFVVRPRRKWVERFAKLESWHKLDDDAHTELSQQVADLPTALLDNDEDAKRFDLLVLRTQLAILQALPDYAALRERLQAIASALEEQEAIPAIKAHTEVIAQATEQSHGLGIFIRSLVGLDRETAKQAFSQFVVGTSATASQLEFINLIVNYLTENGLMDAARLYASPFTDISQQGPEALFLPARVTEMVRVLDEIRARAMA